MKFSPRASGLLAAAAFLHTGVVAVLRNAGRSATITSDGAFVYDYAHHGQDWMMGTCASRARQSPVDFPDMTAPPTGKLSFMYQHVSTSFEIANNGHTYSADVAGMGYGGITYENAWYNLMNINIHAVSEHTFMSQHKPLEIHLVHKKFDSDALLIVAVPLDGSTPMPPPPALVQMGNTSKQALLRLKQMPPAGSVLPGAPVPAPNMLGSVPLYVPPPSTDSNFNAVLQFFLKVAPPVPNAKVVVPVDALAPMDLNMLLRQGTYFEYAGSTTAPPCAEVVTWFVRREPIMASDMQVSYMRDGIFRMTADFGNFRAAMPLNGRQVAVRQGVMEEPPPRQLENSIPLGPNPRTDREFRAMKWAKDALKIAKSATDYIKDLDMRLRGAAQAHANALAPKLMPVYTATPAPFVDQSKSTQPVDIAKIAQSMANTIAQAAKESITAASQQISVEAKAAAMAAAKDAAHMAIEGLPPAPAAGPAAAPAR